MTHLWAGDHRPQISKLSSKNNFNLTVTLTQKLAGCRQLKNESLYMAEWSLLAFNYKPPAHIHTV
jgi:hypothetical protein